jgi:glycosyltransferase involved in cell wall biosynthesis
MDLCNKSGDNICFIMLLNQPPLSPIESENAVVYVKVPHSEVSNHLRAADVAIVVQPDFSWSEWGTHFSPMKLFDYMACGVPVLGSRIGQVSEIIKDGQNGFLFRNTPADLRECLLRAQQNQHQLKEMGRTARREIEQTYNWATVAHRTIDVLEQAVRANARHP